MANSVFLTPVAEDDACGPDLRWSSDFLGLNDALAAAVSQQEGGSVLDAEIARSDVQSFAEIVEMATALSAKTKDVRVLAVHAEASWRHLGLSAFAAAMEDLTAVLETWPGPEDGVHPRADEIDGDLGERAAALGRLLKQIPALAATIGWGTEAGNQEKVESSAKLKSVFGAWRKRLEAALGADLPSSTEAWKSLQGLLVGSNVSDAAADGEEDVDVSDASGAPPPPVLDAWDLIERAVEEMTRQDLHSPALPVLQLLAKWRPLDIVEIADSMKSSGVSLEQLLESIKKQTRQAS